MALAKSGDAHMYIAYEACVGIWRMYPLSIYYLWRMTAVAYRVWRIMTWLSAGGDEIMYHVSNEIWRGYRHI